MFTDILSRNENEYWPKDNSICSIPNLQKIAYLRVFDPDLGPNTGAPLDSCIMQDFEKYYYQNLTIICRAKAWVVDGCGNRDGNLRHAEYFDPNREAICVFVSRTCFTHGACG